MNEQIKSMIKQIIKNTISNSDGTFQIKGDPEICLFCNKSSVHSVPFKFVKGYEDYFVNVPMCKKHFRQFNKSDDYKIKL